jgi:hypothetical protein
MNCRRQQGTSSDLCSETELDRIDRLNIRFQYYRQEAVVVVFVW